MANLKIPYYFYRVTFEGKKAPRGHQQVTHFTTIAALYAMFTEEEIGITRKSFYQMYSRTLFMKPYKKNGVKIERLPMYCLTAKKRVNPLSL